MLGIFIGAAVLGVIISVMEQGEFPGWMKMIVCVLAFAIPAVVLNAILPPYLFIVGLVVGSGCAAGAISLTCGMSFQRAGMAALIFLLIQSAITSVFFFMARPH